MAGRYSGTSIIRPPIGQVLLAAIRRWPEYTVNSIKRLHTYGIKWPYYRARNYRIRPNFRGAQFLWIAFSKHFAETIFADQELRVYGILKFCELNFHGLLKSAKTAKIMRLEDLDVYSRSHYFPLVFQTLRPCVIVTDFYVLSVVFRVYDKDRDGRVSREDLSSVSL